MNTNIKISLTDEDRAKVLAWTGRTGLISRKDLTLLVLGLIEGIKDGTLKPIGTEVELATDAEIKDVIGIEPKARGDRRVCEFVPSRGDEDYLYKPEDPELAAACSSVLDGLEFIEQHAWTTLERNRA